MYLVASRSQGEARLHRRKRTMHHRRHMQHRRVYYHLTQHHRELHPRIYHLGHTCHSTRTHRTLTAIVLRHCSHRHTTPTPTRKHNTGFAYSSHGSDRRVVDGQIWIAMYLKGGTCMGQPTVAGATPLAIHVPSTVSRGNDAAGLFHVLLCLHHLVVFYSLMCMTRFK